MKDNAVTISIGLDLGDKKSHLFALKRGGEILRDMRVSTTRTALAKALRDFPPGQARVVVEAGSHSPWVSRLVEECGQEAVVANPRVVAPLNRAKKRKNDRRDAETLAHWGLQDLYFLAPIKHRGPDAQIDLCTVRSRNCLVEVRTQLVNHVRSLVKIFGERLQRCDTHSFHHKVKEEIPQALRPALWPLLDTIAELTRRISDYEKSMDQLSETKYRETKRLKQVGGVGPLIALAYILTLEDPRRFPRSRNVGAYLGLVPALSATGQSDPQLRISKAGDPYLRRLLIQAAHYILGPFAEDSDLRRHGEKIAQRGGKNAKKRAVVAVARKLAVLLHRLWLTGELYDPLHNANRKARKGRAS